MDDGNEKGNTEVDESVDVNEEGPEALTFPQIKPDQENCIDLWSSERNEVIHMQVPGSRSARHGSWFQQSKLTLQEVMYQTYGILRRERADHIQHKLHFSDHTVANWGMFCRQATLHYMEGCSEKLGGPNRTVEIDESKFGRRKYKGLRVFGGVERESGRTFFVPVPDRTADTLTSVILAWIDPRTTLISDCWAAYYDIGSHGYTHRTVNHSFSIVNPDTGITLIL